MALWGAKMKIKDIRRGFEKIVELSKISFKKGYR